MENFGPQIFCSDYLGIYVSNLVKQRLVDDKCQAEVSVFGTLPFKFADLYEPLDRQLIGFLQMAKVKQFPDKRQALGFHLETQDMDAQIIVIHRTCALGEDEVV